MSLPANLFRRAVSRFARAKRGAAAIEFALVLLPFALLTLGVAEVAMIGFVQSSLDFAVNETARKIRTGEAQMDGMNQAQIEEELCTQMGNFLGIDCAGSLFLDVQRFDSFMDAAGVNSPFADDAFQSTGFGYQPGEPSDIVVVRAFYRWRTLTPMFSEVFRNVANGDRIMGSTMMFRNEPYQ